MDGIQYDLDTTINALTRKYNKEFDPYLLAAIGHLNQHKDLKAKTKSILKQVGDAERNLVKTHISLEELFEVENDRSETVEFPEAHSSLYERFTGQEA